MSNVIFAALFLSVLGLALGLVIGAAAKFFAVKSDPLIDELAAMMPGVNCGACGCAGCFDYAKAMALKEKEPGLCPVMSAETARAVAAKLGLGFHASEKKVAIVLCGGDSSASLGGRALTTGSMTVWRRLWRPEAAKAATWDVSVWEHAPRSARSGRSRSKTAWRLFTRSFAPAAANALLSARKR